MAKQMTVKDLKVLRNELVGIRDVFRKTIKNSRIKNDDETDDSSEIVEIVDIEEPELEEAEVGDVVEVAPIIEGEVALDAPEVLGEIVEIVEVKDEEEIPVASTENTAQVRYRRIKNCKVLRTKNGSYEVLCPTSLPTITTNAKPKPKASAPKRYVRMVNRKSCNTDSQEGRTIEDMQAGVKYVPAYSMDEYATVTRNIAKIDALLTNTQSIKDTVKTEIDEALKESGIVKNTQSLKKRYVRTKNFRTVRNTEGLLEVIIDASGASDCSDLELAQITADSIVDANVDPIDKTLETPTSPVVVEVVMDGIPVAKTENKRATPSKLPTATMTHNAFNTPIPVPLTSQHPDLQPFLASNADLHAMLALAQYCEYPGNADSQEKNEVSTYNAAGGTGEEYLPYGDAAPLEMPSLFPSK